MLERSRAMLVLTPLQFLNQETHPLVFFSVVGDPQVGICSLFGGSYIRQ
jgi:hypothetical protein